MKKLTILSLVLTGVLSFGQNTYIDPTTTAALFTYSNTLTNEQQKTRNQIIDLKKYQAVVGVAMAEVGRVQNLVYKGLKEVSGTMRNGIQVKDILYEIKFINQNAEVISKLARENPQYTIFAVGASKKVKEKAVEMTLKVTEILTSGDNNLMTAGDRYDLLQQIYEDVRVLNVFVLGIRMHLERAKMVGFWKSINPFQGYINTDKDIVRNIVDRYKILTY